jgi:hypothetical protein
MDLRRVRADAKRQNVGPAVFKYEGAGLARFSTTPVHAVAARVNDRGEQIVANGVGQTAVDGAPARCGSLSQWRTRRRDVVTARRPGTVSGVLSAEQRQCRWAPDAG